MSTGKLISLTAAAPPRTRRPVSIPAKLIPDDAAYDARLTHIVEEIKRGRARAAKRGVRAKKSLDDTGRGALEDELIELADIRAAHLAQRITNRKGHAIFASLLKTGSVSAFMEGFQKSDPWGSLIIKEHARPYDEKKPWTRPPKLETLDLAQLHELTQKADRQMRKNKGGRRHSGREVTIIRGFGRLWLEYTGLAPSPGAKQLEGKKVRRIAFRWGGPFIRFLEAANIALDLHLAPSWITVRNALKENPKGRPAG